MVYLGYRISKNRSKFSWIDEIENEIDNDNNNYEEINYDTINPNG